MNYSYAGEVGDWDLSSADYSGSKTVRVSDVFAHCALRLSSAVRISTCAVPIHAGLRRAVD